MNKRNALSAIVLMLLNAPVVRAANEWPEFRGPTGQGISVATNVPTEWSDTKNVAWKLDIPGNGWSSPVLSDGKLYLTTAVGKKGEPVTLFATCIDAASGKPTWSTKIFDADAGSAWRMHGKNSPASPTPIVTKDRLYVHFGHMGTAALDLSGKIVWKQESLKYAPVHGNGGSPALVDGHLIYSCDGGSNPFVVALDAATGQVRWKTPRNTAAKKPFSFCTPLAITCDGKTQVILPGSGFVASYDPATGSESWRVDYGEGYSVVPRPIYSHGLLFLSSGYDSPVVYAINPEHAKGNVTQSNVAWSTLKGAPNTPSLLVVGDEVYFVSDHGIATCADARTGNVHWTHRFDGGFSASPVLAEGRIYFQSEQGMGYVIKAGKEYAEISQNDLHERSLASYAIDNGAIYIRTAGHLWKIGK